MFTGIIEAVGEIRDVKPVPGGFRLCVGSPLTAGLCIGESVALNGVCLTVARSAGDAICLDVSPETARLTTLGTLEGGRTVNLERPMRADGRLSGHLVQGHVDGTGAIEEIRREEAFRWLVVRFPGDVAPYLVRKGSIAVDGISLTVAGLEEQRFTVQIVPHTWEHTNLKAANVGDSVNLECDIIGKYVMRAVELAGVVQAGGGRMEP